MNHLIAWLPFSEDFEPFALKILPNEQADNTTQTGYQYEPSHQFLSLIRESIIIHCIAILCYLPKVRACAIVDTFDIKFKINNGSNQANHSKDSCHEIKESPVVKVALIFLGKCSLSSFSSSEKTS